MKNDLGLKIGVQQSTPSINGLALGADSISEQTNTLALGMSPLQPPQVAGISTRQTINWDLFMYMALIVAALAITAYFLKGKKEAIVNEGLPK